MLFRNSHWSIVTPEVCLGTTEEREYKHQTLQQKIDFWHTEISPSIVSFSNTAADHLGKEKLKIILPEINLVVHGPQNYHL